MNIVLNLFSRKNKLMDGSIYAGMVCACFLHNCICAVQYGDCVLQRLSGSRVIGVIEGGFDVNERLRSAAETAKRPVAGSLSRSVPVSLSVCVYVLVPV